MEREVGGGIGKGNTCKFMTDSFQCMTKPTTIKKEKKRKQFERNDWVRRTWTANSCCLRKAQLIIRKHE